MEEPLKQIKLMRTLYIKDILNYNIHLGTHAKKTTAKMRPFIMGKYYDHAIINIFKTYVHLLKIKLFLTKIIINTGNSNILFISTDKLIAPVIELLANMSMSSYINDVCKGGILTNFKFVSKRRKKKTASWQPRFAESKNKLSSFSPFVRKNQNQGKIDGKNEQNKIFQSLQLASSFKLPNIQRKIILNKLYKISLSSNEKPSPNKRETSAHSLINKQYINKLRIIEKKKKITIKKNHEMNFQVPKIKRKIVLKKFYKIADSNQNSSLLSYSEQKKAVGPVAQKKISRSQIGTFDSDMSRSLSHGKDGTKAKKEVTRYLLKVIGKKIYKIYRPKHIKTKTTPLMESTPLASNVNESINVPSINILNIPTKKKKSNSSMFANTKIKSICRKPRLIRISSSKLSKVFIKDIYKVYYLEPMKIKIFDATNQTEIKTFDINKIENKIFRLPKITADITKTNISKSFPVHLFNEHPSSISNQRFTNKVSLFKDKNISRPTKKISKRNFYSFLDQDIQEFFYPHVSPITMEQYQKAKKRENKKKKIFNKKQKINCQFEEKKYEYIKTGLLNFPQIVIIVGQQKEMKIIKECQKLNILTISISDSDGDPSLTNLFIPGNDDHPISVEYMLKHLAEATEIAKIILSHQNAITDKHVSPFLEKNILQKKENASLSGKKRN